MVDEKDYAGTGLDIQSAMVQHVLENPNGATRSIKWNGRRLWTVYEVPVPKSGKFAIEFLSAPSEPPQGVDVKAVSGAVVLEAGERVETLRTWHDARFEDVVEYPFESKDGRLKVWNVYSRSWPDGRRTEEKWTGNAGLFVEPQADGSLLFRCSSGPANPPDFDQLVFRLSVSER